MAYKLLDEQVIEGSKPRQKRFHFAHFNGRVGVSFFLGTKEVFIGVSVADVIEEQIIKKRVIKTPKGKVNVLRFDPFSS